LVLSLFRHFTLFHFLNRKRSGCVWKNLAMSGGVNMGLVGWLTRDVIPQWRSYIQDRFYPDSEGDVTLDAFLAHLVRQARFHNSLPDGDPEFLSFLFETLLPATVPLYLDRGHPMFVLVLRICELGSYGLYARHPKALRAVLSLTEVIDAANVGRVAGGWVVTRTDVDMPIPRVYFLETLENYRVYESCAFFLQSCIDFSSGADAIRFLNWAYPLLDERFLQCVLQVIFEQFNFNDGDIRFHVSSCYTLTRLLVRMFRRFSDQWELLHLGAVLVFLGNDQLKTQGFEQLEFLLELPGLSDRCIEGLMDVVDLALAIRSEDDSDVILKLIQCLVGHKAIQPDQLMKRIGGTEFVFQLFPYVKDIVTSSVVFKILAKNEMSAQIAEPYLRLAMGILASQALRYQVPGMQDAFRLLNALTAWRQRDCQLLCNFFVRVLENSPRHLHKDEVVRFVKAFETTVCDEKLQVLTAIINAAGGAFAGTAQSVFSVLEDLDAANPDRFTEVIELLLGALPTASP
jgi:hypothetical protein